MQNSTEKQIIDLIKKSNKVLVLPSSPADGDSIGSAIALYMVLKKLQKDVTVICAEGVPEVLQFLPNMRIVGNKTTASNDFIITIDVKGLEINDIKSSVEDDKLNIILTPEEGHISEDRITLNKAETDYDLIITVDCAELQQIKGFYEKNPEMFTSLPVINIDHHISNAHFGKLNHVDIMASSTTELLLPIFEQLAEDEGIDLIDEDIATLLLTGIITDTGSFQNANTTPKAFAKAAKLVSYGARQQEIIQHIYKTKQLSQLKLWGRVLSKIQTDNTHRIVWSVVSQQDFKDTESNEEETGDIIDELMTNAPGAEVIMLMKEKKDGIISVSVRTTSPAVDAAKIAENFGGGGHTQAAGFRIDDLNFREAEYKVIKYVQKLQKERLDLPKENEEEVREEPMIDVEKLIDRAEKAQQAKEFTESLAAEEKTKKFSKTKTTTKKTTKKTTKSKLKLKTPKPEEATDKDTKYKFED